MINKKQNHPSTVVCSQFYFNNQASSPRDSNCRCSPFLSISALSHPHHRPHFHGPPCLIIPPSLMFTAGGPPPGSARSAAPRPLARTPAGGQRWLLRESPKPASLGVAGLRKHLGVWGWMETFKVACSYATPMGVMCLKFRVRKMCPTPILLRRCPCLPVTDEWLRPAAVRLILLCRYYALTRF